MNRKRIPHVVPAIAVAAATIAALAVSASMLSNLRLAFGRRQREEADRPGGGARRDRIRRALAPILMEIHIEDWERDFGKLPDGFDRDAFTRNLVIDPPLSQAIIEERYGDE